MQRALVAGAGQRARHDGSHKGVRGAGSKEPADARGGLQAHVPVVHGAGGGDDANERNEGIAASAAQSLQAPTISVQWVERFWPEPNWLTLKARSSGWSAIRILVFKSELMVRRGG